MSPQTNFPIVDKNTENNSLRLFLNITNYFEIFHLSFSIKFQKEDEWMIDPVMIADTYGPEVLLFLLRVNELSV